MLGDVSGARVLDLYAGSGALGIEALSRGAASARVRRARPRARSPRYGATSRPSASTPRSRSQDALRFLARPEGAFDLVFCDPPYDDASRLAAPLAEALPAMLEEDARIVTESDKRNPLDTPAPARGRARPTATRGSRSTGRERDGTAARRSCRAPTTRSRMGHLDIIGRAANVFDNVIVGVVNQPVRKQKTVFSAEERVAFIEAEVAEYAQCAGKTL